MTKGVPTESKALAPASATEFIPTTGFSPGEIESSLGELFTVRRERPESFERAWLDSWDWRVYRSGFSLEEDALPEGAALCWRHAGGPILFRAALPAPRFAMDLPEGNFRSALEEIVEMRALMPVARAHVKRRALSLLDADKKTLCRILIEEYRVKAAPARPLCARVRIEPLLGYGEQAGRVQAALAESLCLGAAGAGVLKEILTATGIKPSKYTSKVKVELRPDVPALEAARTILSNLFETMKVNEEGLLSDIDSEFLHDYRVAVRRTRSALGQIKGVFPPPLLKRFAPEFAWLGSVTGPSRDLDVHLLDFPRYRAALPPERREDLAPLHALLEKLKKNEHSALVEALNSRRYLKFREDWEKKLRKPLAPTALSPLGKAPVGEVAGKRIHKIFRRALREGKALCESSPPEEFHELRKTCKKLRYLIEFFQTLYPPGEVRQFLVFLKGLQDNLGEFQDIQVQSAALREYSRELWRGRESGPEAIVAIGMLLEKLALRGEEVRREFSAKFKVFASRENRGNFEALFAAKPQGDGGGE